MLLSAPPLLHTLAEKRLLTTYTGRSLYCDSARTAPPPMSGPSRSQRLPVNTELTMRNRPPRGMASRALTAKFNSTCSI